MKHAEGKGDDLSGPRWSEFLEGGAGGHHWLRMNPVGIDQIPQLLHVKPAREEGETRRDSAALIVFGATWRRALLPGEGPGER